MKIFMDLSETKKLNKKLKKRPAEIRRRLDELPEQAEDFLMESLVINASGPPGPNVVTGQYVANFTTILEKHKGGFVLGAENRSPQAARLEYGFFGVDSLGRNYAQAPRPHFRPSLIMTQLWYMARVRKILGDELR
jgi:hypothetical protein